jgi:hypothetical protein
MLGTPATLRSMANGQGSHTTACCCLLENYVAQRDFVFKEVSFHRANAIVLRRLGIAVVAVSI